MEVRQIAEPDVIRYRTHRAWREYRLRKHAVGPREPLFQHELAERAAVLFEQPLQIPGADTEVGRNHSYRKIHSIDVFDDEGFRSFESCCPGAADLCALFAIAHRSQGDRHQVIDM